MDRKGPEAIVICSLTKAGAVEIASRVQIPKQNVGTLHALCLHANRELDDSIVLDSPKGVKAWNEWIGGQEPAVRWMALTGGTDPDDPSGMSEPGPGNVALERMNLLRHRLVPRELWPDTVRGFADHWGRAMVELDACDFTSMIELARDSMDAPPGRPSVFLCDEYQDFSALEGSLIRKWAQSCDLTILAGDEDQSIFGWRGAAADGFSAHPPAGRTPLTQSHRVPQEVHALAMRVIRQVKGRTDNPYLPTPEKGRVSFEPGSWRKPETWVDDVVRASEDGGAMVLASCAYMLKPFLALLREEGIPFHNPFRRSRGDWNPLGNPNGETKTAGRQLLAYLGADAEGWTTDQLRMWIPLLRSAKRDVTHMDETAALRRGAKQAILRCPRARPTAEEYLGLFLDQESIGGTSGREIAWLLKNATEKDRERLSFPLNIMRRGGAPLIESTPKIAVGTIHSVKGGESRHVFVLTALPTRWAQEQGDEVTRLFYVAITRARESVTVLNGDRGGFEGI